MAGATTIGDLVFFLRGKDSGFTKMLNGAEKKARAVGQSMQNVGKSLTSIGKKAALAGAAISGALGLAVKKGADFEQAISNAASVTGATGDEFEIAKEKLEALAKELGITTVFSATEAAEAMYDLASKGFDVANFSLEELIPLLDLAAATQDDLTHATQTVTGTLRAYNLENDETTRIADVFTKVIGSSAATMDKLASSMAFVAPVANAAGVELEEMTAVLGKLFDANIDGSTAGTSMRRTIAELISPSDKLVGTLKRLGLTTEDINLETHTLTDIFDTLKKRGFSAADAMDVFGQRAGPAVITIAGLGKETNESITALRELNQKLNDAGGTAANVAALQLSTLNGQTKLLKSAIEGVVLEIAGALIPRLTEWATKGAELFQRVAKWMADNEELKNTIIRVVAAIGVGLAVGGTLSIVLGTIISMVGAVVIAVSAIIPAVVAVAGVIGTVGLPIIAAIGVAIAALAAMLVPIGAFIWLVVQRWIEQAGGLAAIWSKVSMFLIAVWVGLKQMAISAFEAVMEFWLENRELFLKTLNTLVNTTVSLINFVLAFIQKAWPVVVELTRTAMAVLVPIIRSAWNMIWGVIKTVMQLINGDTEAAWETVKETVINALAILWETLVKFWGFLFPFLAQKFDDVIGLVGDWILHAVDTIVGGFRSHWNSIIDVITYPFKAAFAVIVEGMNWVVSQLNKIQIDIPEWLNKLPGVDFGGKSFGFNFAKMTVPEFAKGGRMGHDGLAMVGERGRELVGLGRGAQVLNNAQTEQAVGGVNLSVNVGEMSVRNDQDIRNVAAQLKDLFDEELRGRGIGAIAF